MKSIKKLIVALSVALGFAACAENATFTEVDLEATPVYLISDIAFSSGTDNASDVLQYTVYTDLDDIIAWQYTYYTLRMNKIENFTEGNSLVAGETEEENVTTRNISFDEVYSGDVTVTSPEGEITSSTVNMRRKFDISVSAEDGVGTMTITEYDNSVATYTMVLTDTEEWQEVE